MEKTKCGIIGCGMISDTYFKAAKRFRNLEIIACSDNKDPLPPKTIHQQIAHEFEEMIRE